MRMNSRFVHMLTDDLRPIKYLILLKVYYSNNGTNMSAETAQAVAWVSS
jgi:hypothetical protein